MAVTSYEKVIVDKELLDNVANKIQQKASISGGLKLTEMDTALDSIASPDGLIDGSIDMIKSNVTSIRQYCFQKATNLKVGIFPECLKINTYAFSESGFTSLSLPKVETLTNYAFNQSKLPIIELPNVKIIISNSFYQNRVLETVYIPIAEKIQVSAFRYCYILKSL